MILIFIFHNETFSLEHNRTQYPCSARIVNLELHIGRLQTHARRNIITVMCWASPVCTVGALKQKYHFDEIYVDGSTWILNMMTSSNGNIFTLYWPFVRGIPHTKASDAELWCFLWFHLNKRLCKQSWGWWLEMPSWSLWRHRNVKTTSGLASHWVTKSSSTWQSKLQHSVSVWIIFLIPLSHCTIVTCGIITLGHITEFHHSDTVCTLN